MGRAHAAVPVPAALIPRPELLGAAVIGMFMSAFLYQVLHFRHLWALLGIVGALVAIPIAAALRLLLQEVTFRRLDQS